MQVSRWAISLLLGFGVVVISTAIIRGGTPVKAYFQLRQSRDILQRSNQDLVRENSALSLEIEKIEQSSSYAKRLLKEKYHVLEPGEKIVFFEDGEDSCASCGSL